MACEGFIELLVDNLELDFVRVALELWSIHAGDTRRQGAELAGNLGSDTISERVFASC